MDKTAATPYHFTLLLTRALQRFSPGAPSLGEVCREVLEEPDTRRAHKALAQLRRRKERGARGGHPEGGLAGLFRWFLAPSPVDLAGAVRARYLELLAGPLDTIESIGELYIGLHLLGAWTEDPAEQQRLGGILCQAIGAAPLSQIKSRTLRGLVHHLLYEFGWELAPSLWRWRGVYEPADLAHTLALGALRSEAAGALYEEHLAGLSRGDPAVLGLTLLHVVLRLGAVADPVVRRRAQGHLAAFAASHGDRLRAMPIGAFCAYAGRVDYGVDLAEVVAARAGETVDLLRLAEEGLAWLSRSPGQRLRGELSAAECVRLTRRFERWAFHHRVCQPIFVGLRPDRSARWQALWRLSWMGKDLPLVAALSRQMEAWMEGVGGAPSGSPR